MVVHAFNNPRIQKAEAVGNLFWLNTSPARHTETLSQRNKKVNPSGTLSTIWRPLSLEIDANFRKAKPVILSFLLLMKIGSGVYLWGAWFLGTLCTMWNNLQELLRKARQQQFELPILHSRCDGGGGETHPHRSIYGSGLEGSSSVQATLRSTVACCSGPLRPKMEARWL